MKIRWTVRGVRVRLDDLEVAALLAGQVLEAALSWPGGGWRVVLDPGASGVQGQAQTLRIGLLGEQANLADEQREGVSLIGPPRVEIQKEYLPEHLR